jgi:hypothetical protein
MLGIDALIAPMVPAGAWRAACKSHQDRDFVRGGLPLTGITSKTVSQIIHGHASFSPDLAIQFERVLGIAAEIWIGMLSSYQLLQSRREAGYGEPGGGESF